MRAGALFCEQRDEEVGQQERSEDVGREGQLDAIDRERPLARQRAGVVDEHVQAPRLAAERSANRRTDFRSLRSQRPT